MVGNVILDDFVATRVLNSFQQEPLRFIFDFESAKLKEKKLEKKTELETSRKLIPSVFISEQPLMRN